MVNSTATATDWLVSVDDHVIEPPTVWTDRLPAKYQDIGPRMVDSPEGELWLYEDKRVATVAMSVAAGHDTDFISPNPVHFKDMRPGLLRPGRPRRRHGPGPAAGLDAASRRSRATAARSSTRPRTRTSPCCACRPGTTSSSRSVAGRSGPLHPDDDHPAVGSRLPPPPRSSARAARAPSRSPSPRTRPSSGCRRSTPALGPGASGGCNDAGLVVSMHVGSSSNLIRTSRGHAHAGRSWPTRRRPTRPAPCSTGCSAATSSASRT